MATIITTRGTIRALIAANVSLDEVLSSTPAPFKVIHSGNVTIVSVAWDPARTIVSITDDAKHMAESRKLELLREIERAFVERSNVVEFRTGFRRIRLSWDPQIGEMHVSVK